MPTTPQAHHPGDDHFDPRSDRNRKLGLIVLALLRDWHSWVHRRVEHMTFEDPVSVRRQVSVDFTVGAGLPPALRRQLEREGRALPPIFVPLGLLRKEKLTGFSMWDETGRALPLLTSRRNGTLAAAVLLAAAEAQFGRLRQEQGGTVVPPPAVAENLMAIASSQPLSALRVWGALGRDESVVEDETDEDRSNRADWRQLLVTDELFMGLANDLARNSLVLVPLRPGVEDRRIVKFAYTEQPERPKPMGLTDLWRAMRTRSAPARNESVALGATGAGRIAVAVAISGAPDHERAKWYGQITVLTQHPTGQQEQIRLDHDGCAMRQLPVGVYTCTVSAPSGFVELSPGLQTVSVETGKESALRFELRALASRLDRSKIPSPTPGTRLARWLGLEAHQVVVLTPAIAHAYGFHLEIDAPEGLMISAAALRERPAYLPVRDHPAAEGDGRQDIVRFSVQRAHLYLCGVPQGASGIATVRMRPRSTTIVRAASLAAMFCAFLLAIVAWREPHIVSNQGSVVALLVLVPSALSAYVARPREPEVTSSMIFGPRILALLPALLCVGAAAIVTFARSRTVNSMGQEVAGDNWDHAQLAVAVLAILCLAIAVLQRTILRRIRKPPEQQPGALRPVPYGTANVPARPVRED